MCVWKSEVDGHLSVLGSQVQATVLISLRGSRDLNSGPLVRSVGTSPTRTSPHSWPRTQSNPPASASDYRLGVHHHIWLNLNRTVVAKYLSCLLAASASVRAHLLPWSVNSMERGNGASF